MMSEEKLKVRFVKGMDDIFARGFCAFWLKEIHIDERYRNHPALSRLVEHEKKHYAIIKRIQKTESRLKKGLLILYNNFWDFLDVWRIDMRFFRREFVVEVAIILFWLGLILYQLFVVMTH